jgi:hypothetical protein
VPTARGPLPKEVRVYAQRLEIRYGFSAWGLCPPGSLRVGFVTLLPGTLGDELWLSCANGGPRERLPLRADCDHTRGSGGGGARALLGATDGWLALDDGRRGIELSWPQEEAPALALVTLRREGALRLVRVTFSLAERDGAISDGGGGARETPLHDFRFSIRPYRRRR